MTKPLPNGIVASTVTPFNSDGTVRFEQIPAHIDWIIAEGAHGLSPLGSSGEFPAMEMADRKRVLEAALGRQQRPLAGAGRHALLFDPAHDRALEARPTSRRRCDC